MPRPRVKRSATLSLVNALAASSHFYTPYVHNSPQPVIPNPGLTAFPQMFPSEDAPRYIPGGIALSVFCIGVASIAIVIKFALRHQNRKMQRLDDEGAAYTGSLEAIPKGYRFTL